MIIALLIPVVLAVVLAAAVRLPRRAVVALAALPWVGWLVTAPWWLPAAIAGRGPTFVIEWLPSLGMRVSGGIDALAAVILLLVAGVGLGVVLYTGAYVDDLLGLRRFLSMLTAFGASMAGLAVSDGLFGAYLWWEMTTITSYLLIGFNDSSRTARESALRAIITTSFGSLAMLGGIVLLWTRTGTDSFAALAANPPGGTTAVVAMLLIFLGAFSKSAQVPFNGWLPDAMAAPTPASAYLHSATMVKAGILLLLRLAPAFGELPVWTEVVTVVGLATMVTGAWGALRQNDLKLLLAFGTVSQLGFMVTLVGVGTPEATFAAVAVLLAHGMFKSTLFLVVGVIDRVAGTRDLRVLSGVGRRHPVLATIAALAAASMAGVPPLLGFVAKETALHLLLAPEHRLTLIVLAAASALTAAYSLRFWMGAFKTEPANKPTESDEAPRLMVGVPLVLSALGLVFGCLPWLIEPLVAAASGHAGHLALWSGFNAPLLISGVILLAGLTLWWRKDDLTSVQADLARTGAAFHFPTSDGLYRGTMSRLLTYSYRLTGVIQNGSLPVYLGVIITAVLGVPAVVFTAFDVPDTVWAWSWLEVTLLTAIIAAALMVARVPRRMAAVLLVGTVGYGVAALFIISGAPDLALTLLLVETVTTGLFAWVLLRLAPRFEQATWPLGSTFRGAVALFAGVVVGTGAYYAAAARREPSVSREMIELAVPEAGGANVVNVIITDFRALDTLGEITVLAVAAIGIAGLLRSRDSLRRHREALAAAREAAVAETMDTRT